MAIVVISYRQTVRAYPDGGGAFIVAHDNLGLPSGHGGRGLAAHRLRAHGGGVGLRRGGCRSPRPPRPWCGYRVPLALVLVLLLTLANLRGVRESSTLFAAPTYAFVVIVVGHPGHRIRALPRRHLPPGGVRRGGPASGVAGVSSVPGTAGLRLRGQRPDRDRGHRQRGPGLPPPEGAQRGRHPGDDGGPGHHHVPGDQHPGPAVQRAGERGHHRRVTARSSPRSAGPCSGPEPGSSSCRRPPLPSSCWGPTPPTRTSPGCRPSWQPIG